MKEAVRADEQP